MVKFFNNNYDYSQVLEIQKDFHEKKDKHDFTC